MFLLFLKAIIIGIVEGITEFLPISSTAHMIIVGHFINFTEASTQGYATMFQEAIQIGAILAIVVLYWEKIKNSIKSILHFGWGFKLWANILVAFFPAALIGLILNSKIDEYLFTVLPVAIGMLVGGILLLLVENWHRGRKKQLLNNIENIDVMQAVKIGLFQCLSLWPGMSRSASTIMGGWVSDLSTSAAAEFSFFLAIPTMVAVTGYKLFKYKDSTSIPSDAAHIIALALGIIVSFLVALVVVEKFVNFLKKKPMRIFAIYRILAGLILLVLCFTINIKK
ncbi:MAG TPA: undecaprenyl-diphosphate phosphatase [Clostridiaceae bacterium]